MAFSQRRIEREKDLHAVIPSSAMHHLGMNPQATSSSPLKWTQESE